MFITPSFNDADAELKLALLLRHERRKDIWLASCAAFLAGAGVMFGIVAIVLWQFYDELPDDRVVYMLPFILYVFAYPVVMVLTSVISLVSYSAVRSSGRAVTLWLSIATLVTWGVAVYTGRGPESLGSDPPISLLAGVYVLLTLAAVIVHRHGYARHN